MCDLSIIFGPVEEIDPLKLVPTTSTTCMSIVCDLIISGLMERKSFKTEDYGKLHKGGYIGFITNK